MVDSSSSQNPIASSKKAASDKGVGIWLLAIAVLIALIVIVGGLTRLTESGLSITEWRPVTGMLPPLSDAAWEAEFANYRGTTQYTLLNEGMGLAGFKTIYWWEWGHRISWASHWFRLSFSFYLFSCQKAHHRQAVRAPCRDLRPRRRARCAGVVDGAVRASPTG